MIHSLAGKVAIVTGGNSGIGAAITKVLRERGARVFVLDLAEGAKDSLRCDVTKQQEVREAVDGVVAEAGRLDILVNNAGIGFVGTLEQTAEADLDRLYAVNVKGVYNCALAAIGHLKDGGGGVILNMASIAATVGIAERFAYSMTKGAVLTMTYSLAKDYLAHGIRCNSISPARVHTPFVDQYLERNYPGREAEVFDQLSATQPIGRMGRPEEVGYLAAYLCSDEAAFITGTDFPIDGGYIKLNG
ncbi:NAD(P)-dependent dehydrogenase (short-subunit alcohol dehydrogenase family) [Lewinella marina]|uniref:Short-chain dehydrogenase n=1 Tax=Neolewinella marina TaxID=438751 RepID=A0A2G0CCK3_9BACT|nr:SDR family oxidoreductase [Neolewinella marina]NJB87617.1 NAD(P)-dependent dehydrogenase (short-subunit alcohol dehydrogenase family) [Neolewinella marina]PHK97695.1 short-chain dehydrogenase [Neolewinella marina]